MQLISATHRWQYTSNGLIASLHNVHSFMPTIIIKAFEWYLPKEKDRERGAEKWWQLNKVHSEGRRGVRYEDMKVIIFTQRPNCACIRKSQLKNTIYWDYFKVYLSLPKKILLQYH